MNLELLSEEHRSALSPLSKVNLREQAKHAIRTSIITGQVVRGRIYSASYFGSYLGVSVTPVREALFDLACEGLVEVVRNRGFRAPILSDQDVDRILELRIMLEVPALRRVVSTLDPESLKECRDYAKRGEELAAAGDVAGFLWLDRLFHRRLLESLPNRYLVDVIMRFRDLTPLIGLPSLAKSGQLIASAKEHTGILDVIEQRDPERTEALMRRHLEHVRGIWSGRPETADEQTSLPPAGPRQESRT